MRRESGLGAIQLLPLLAAAVFLSACPDFIPRSWVGKYTDATSGVSLELKSGGKATIAMFGTSQNCTYTATYEKINLDCGKDLGKVAFKINSDGSLSPENQDFPMRLVKR